MLVSQLLPYQSGVDLLATLAQIQTNNNFLHRLTQCYGQQLETQLTTTCPCRPPESATSPSADASPVVYALADGSMLLTDEGYHEAKVGRIFPQRACQASGVEGRNGQLTESVYCAHLGDVAHFKPLFTQSLAPYQAAGCQVVFLSDGAIWLRQMMEVAFPEAVLILDLYHVMEWLGRAAQASFRHEWLRQLWLEEQRNRLVTSDVDGVLTALASLNGPAELLAQVQTYLQANRDRMDYAHYRARGWLIGSGAVESAHRTLLQSRLKLSGQRWSQAGANRLIALRVYVANGWHEAIRELIEPCPARYAMAA